MHTQQNFVTQHEFIKDAVYETWHPAGMDGFQISPLKAQILYAFYMGATCGSLPYMAEKLSVSIQTLKDSLADLLCGQFLLHAVSQHKATFALTTKGMAALEAIAANKPEFIAMTDQLLAHTPYSPNSEPEAGAYKHSGQPLQNPTTTKL